MTTTRPGPLRRTDRLSPAPESEPICEALSLLRRRAAIQTELRRGCGSVFLQERELYLINGALARFPAVLRAITQTAAELDRPVEALSVREVAKRCAPCPPPGPMTRLRRIGPSTQARELATSP